MSTEFNDQWILDRINAPRRLPPQKSAWPVRGRRSRRSSVRPLLITEAVRVLDKNPKWIDRDT
jgi:hypothetical protein